jgi:hypothetical protein
MNKYEFEKEDTYSSHTINSHFLNSLNDHHFPTFENNPYNVDLL